MPYEKEEDYKYVQDKDEIPVTGQDIERNWDDDEIHSAVEKGEEKLEADVNGGDPISSPTSLHGEAAATWATYKLVLGMKAPDASTRGDSLDEGAQRMEFADRVRRMYNDLIESIAGSDADASTVGAVDFQTFDY